MIALLLKLLSILSPYELDYEARKSAGRKMMS